MAKAVIIEGQVADQRKRERVAEPNNEYRAEKKTAEHEREQLSSRASNTQSNGCKWEMEEW